MGVSGGGLSTQYACSTTCSLPRCHCASSNTPGGFQPSHIPQFMTLTFDDDVNSIIYPVIQNLTQGFNNPNGCPLSATFFLSVKWTNFWEIQQLYGQGHEIAIHTMNHVGNPPPSEILGAQAAISAFAGIPQRNISGFRTPFLLYSTDTFKTLSNSPLFHYDSSMSVDYQAAP